MLSFFILLLQTPAWIGNICNRSRKETNRDATRKNSHSNDEQFKDIFFAKIDVDELPEVSQELGIRAMPTFMLFKDGEKAEELVGANPTALVTLLKKGVEA